MNEQYNKMASDLAKAGRFGDDQIIHVSRSEVEGLGSLLPSGKLPTNPKTGQPEAFVITVPMLLTALASGAVVGGTAGGVTAKQRGIPLWEGILTGAGKGAATGLVTAGLGAAITPAATPAALAVEQGANVVANQAATTLANVSEGVGANIVPGLTDVASAAAVDPGAIAPLLDSGTIAPLVDPGVVAPAVLDPGVPLTDSAGSQWLSEGPIDSIAHPDWVGSGTPPAPTADFIGPGSTGSPLTPVDATSVVTPDSLSADPGFLESMSESVQDALGPNSTEYLSWLVENPQLAMAPGLVELATGRSEWDEDDYPEYDGPLGTSWTTGPGTAENPSWATGSGSAGSPSWAARDGGEVRRREPDSTDDSGTLSRIKALIAMLEKTANPTIPGKYNPLSDHDMNMELRPSISGGMHRVGVTLPFRHGGLASNNLRSRGLGSLRRP